MNKQLWLVINGCDLITTHKNKKETSAHWLLWPMRQHYESLLPWSSRWNQTNICGSNSSPSKTWKALSISSKSVMGRLYLRRCQIATNWMYFFFFFALPPIHKLSGNCVQISSSKQLLIFHMWISRTNRIFPYSNFESSNCAFSHP